MTQAIWIITIFIFYFFHNAPTAKAEIDPTQILLLDPYSNLTCPTTDYSEYTIHASFFSQASMIIDYGGIIFNIAIYGVKSKFSSTTTFLLDDISIFAISFTPTVSWYFIAKPIYLYYDEPNEQSTDSSNLQLKIIILLGISSLIFFLFITYLLILYNWPCHNGYLWKKQRTYFFTERSLYWLRNLVIHTYLMHSIVIILYDSINVQNYKYLSIADFINFQVLNFSTDILYFFLSSFLVFEFHYRNIVHKKIFFFTVFLSTTQILFEYALVCSPPYIDTLFTFALTTILTRSVASYFSESEKTVTIYGTEITLVYGKKEVDGINPNGETAMKYRGIRLIFDCENDVKKLELYGTKVTLINGPDINTADEKDEKAPIKPVKVTLVYENNSIIEQELDITGKTIKFKIIDGFAFLNYVIYTHRKFDASIA